MGLLRVPLARPRWIRIDHQKQLAKPRARQGRKRCHLEKSGLLVLSAFPDRHWESEPAPLDRSIHFEIPGPLSTPLVFHSLDSAGTESGTNSGDDMISPGDALAVINHINAVLGGEGEDSASQSVNSLAATARQSHSSRNQSSNVACSCLEISTVISDHHQTTVWCNTGRPVRTRLRLAEPGPKPDPLANQQERHPTPGV
jgi:hypothetical protein